MFVIEDRTHCDLNDGFETFELALAELKRRARLPWDQEPNRAPCNKWRTCDRSYDVVEYDVSERPRKLIRRVSVLKVSADGVEWAYGFGD